MKPQVLFPVLYKLDVVVHACNHSMCVCVGGVGQDQRFKVICRGQLEMWPC